MEMLDALGMVRRFHRHIGAQVADEPRLLPCHNVAARWLGLQIEKLSHTAAEGAGDDVLLSRVALALEELSEWIQAHADRDLEAAADAWADRCYVLLGDAVATGLPAEAIFAEVHKSNMTKQLGVRTGHGKAFRGPRYHPPQFGELLQTAEVRP
jgi:predicted HAD superfamily Cof-like phosphohydrolase